MFRPQMISRCVAKLITLFCQSAEPEINQTLVDVILDAQFAIDESGAPGAQALKNKELLRQTRKQLGAILISIGREAWGKLANWKQTGVLVSGDIYLKALERSPEAISRALRWYDVIFVDEAQDVNPVMLSIVNQSGKAVIAVGDPFQQIYSWRGAEDALDRLRGPKLFLTQSFRFGEAIAEMARVVLNSKPVKRPEKPLRGNPGRQSKVILYETQQLAMAPVILCRSNAGVISASLACAEAGKRFHVVGGTKDLEIDIRSSVALHEGKREYIRSENILRFSNWQEMVAEAEQMGDYALKRLIDMVESKRSGKVLQNLSDFHEEDKSRAGVVISTGHKAKGLEWPVVAMGTDWRPPEKLIKAYKEAVESGKQSEIQAALEEWHVLYVALTRAVDVLALPRALVELLKLADRRIPGIADPAPQLPTGATGPVAAPRPLSNNRHAAGRR